MEQLTTVESVGSFDIRLINEDKIGKFWFCNTQYRYNIYPAKKENGLINYEREKGIEELKAANTSDFIYYLSIIEDTNQVLWMTTYDEVIWR